MVSIDASPPEESRRQAFVEAENRRHRSIIADAVKQMVLIVISLGLPNAYTILAKPEDVAQGHGPHLVQLSLSSVLIFVLYVLIGTRFLLTSWLYLSTTYRDDNPKKLKILPDALGIFLTGVVVGMQSCFASANSLPDFFQIFCLVLLIDVVFSIASVGMNWQAVKAEGLRQEVAWIGNNIVFGIATFVVVLEAPPFEYTGPRAYWLMLLAFLNSGISFGISWAGYFRAQRAVPRHHMRP